MYSWIRLTWTSKSESGSTTSPVADRSQSANRALACALGRAEAVRGRRGRRRGGRSAASRARSVTQPSPIASVSERGEPGVGQQQPAPRGDAVGLVVEPLGEQPGEVPQHGLPQQPGVELGDAVGAVRPDDRQVRHPDLLLRALLDQADPRNAAVVAGRLRADLVEEPAVDLVDDLQQPRGQHARRSGPATAPGPPAGACGWCRRGSARSGPTPRPSRARPRRAGSASARRRPARGGCR